MKSAERRADRIAASLKAQMAVPAAGCCRWCGAAVTGRRRNWCSEACVAVYRLLSRATEYRPVVFARDRGICTLCGWNVGAAQRRVELWRARLEPVLWGPRPLAVPMSRELRLPWREPGSLVWARFRLVESSASRGARQAALDRLVRVLRRLRLPTDRSLWEVDHIVALAEGGQHRLDNLRLVCHRCHKGLNRELAGRLRGARGTRS